MTEAFIGVDVGTGSARAGVFDAAGGLVASAKRVIAIWREPGNIVEQSSDDIWRAVTAAVREAVEASGLPPRAIAGIGFAATCSLVVLDPDGRPLSVSLTDAPERDMIVWMDHRAVADADRINAGGHQALRYVGGRISPEMQTPKLAWLARRKPETFARAGHFFNLTDYLTWRATGALQRSICAVACKFAYLAHEKRWAGEFFDSVGLGALKNDGFARIGGEVVEPGFPLGRGLTPEAAASMGLEPGTPVGAGLIDAHAGALGTIGASDDGRTATATPPRADPRHLGLLHGGFGRPTLHRHVLGAAPFRVDTRPVADRGRPIGVRGGDRPSAADTSGLRRIVGARRIGCARGVGDGHPRPLGGLSQAALIAGGPCPAGFPLQPRAIGRC